MADGKMRKQVNAGPGNPRKTARLCEYMAYSGQESFKRLRTNVLISLSQGKEKKNYVIGTTSAQPSEGKSTVSINLAYSFAELGRSVILIDCDMRRPAIHANVGTKLSPGLSEVLNGRENLNNTVVRYQSSTNSTSFDLIVGGETPDNPSELLNSERFRTLVDVVSDAYDIVILDLPPVNAVVDAAVVSALTDGMVFVIRENHCPRAVLADSMEQLRYAKANILGFVMNGSVSGAGKRSQYSKNGGYNRYY